MLVELLLAAAEVSVPADHPTIQQAIDHVAENHGNGVIYLDPGVYPTTERDINGVATITYSPINSEDLITIVGGPDVVLESTTLKPDNMIRLQDITLSGETSVEGGTARFTECRFQSPAYMATGQFWIDNSTIDDEIYADEGAAVTLARCLVTAPGHSVRTYYYTGNSLCDGSPTGYDLGGNFMCADANRDGEVDINDIAVVIEAWDCEGDCRGDQNLDGIVDIDDFVIVISHWDMDDN